MKIILDAFGGDHAPCEVIKGAYNAIDIGDISFILCGDKNEIERVITELSLPANDNIEIVHAPQKIEGNDDPVSAIREKKDSSMVVGLNLLKEGVGDAFISAGNTGALLTGGTLITRRIRGVKRAALGTIMPTEQGPSLLIDAGANVSVTNDTLVQFALMGSVYMQALLNIENPRVGLLNIGTEERKGTETIMGAFQTLKSRSDINFIGNHEVRDILKGGCEVMVADGWTGNIILKTLEGTAAAFMGSLKDIFSKNTLSKISYLGVKGGLREFKNKYDYKEYGGAPIIGLSNAVIKAHGSSDAKAFESAVRQAKNYVDENVIEKIKSHINNNA